MRISDVVQFCASFVRLFEFEWLACIDSLNNGIADSIADSQCTLGPVCEATHVCYARPVVSLSPPCSRRSRYHTNQVTPSVAMHVHIMVTMPVLNRGASVAG